MESFRSIIRETIRPSMSVVATKWRQEFSELKLTELVGLVTTCILEALIEEGPNEVGEDCHSHTRKMTSGVDQGLTKMEEPGKPQCHLNSTSEKDSEDMRNQRNNVFQDTNQRRKK